MSIFFWPYFGEKRNFPYDIELKKKEGGMLECERKGRGIIRSLQRVQTKPDVETFFYQTEHHQDHHRCFPFWLP